MSKRGRNITLFLMDGSATGRIKCTLANWTGVAYKIPRTELDSCRERNDLKQSGVYFLFGTSDETGKSVVYIGQAGVRQRKEGILSRLLEHKRNPEKDYWTEAVVFTTSNNSFGATEISYLENRFCNMAIGAERYIVKNNNDPTPGNITEEKESELEDFIDYAKIIMVTLGHRVFEPLIKEKKNDSVPEQRYDDDKILFFKRKIRKSEKIIEARCMQTEEGFVVLKGSTINPIDASRIPSGVKKARQNASIDNNGILQENVLFNSPSYAAAFVIGDHTNGLIAWKNQTGKTLKEIERS